MFYGDYLTQCVTEADAKRWARDHAPCEVVAITEKVNGKIVQSREYELPESEEDAGADDLSFLDPDDIDLDDSDLLNPAMVRAKIENAKLRAQLDASRNGNGHSPIMERLFEQLLSEKLQRVDPLDELVAREEKAERLRAIYAPPRRENPAPVQPQRSEDEVLASAILKQPEVIETLLDSALKRVGGRGDNDEPWFADIVRKAVDNGQAAQIVGAIANPLGNGLGNLISSISSWLAPKSAQTPPQAPAPPVPQATQPTAPVIEAAQEPAQLPANEQQTQATQTEQPQVKLTPADELIYGVISLLDRKAPVSEARNLINVATYRSPELEDSVDNLIDLPVDQILALLGAYHPPALQWTHARTWLESLVNALTAEGGDEFDEVTEINEGGVKL
jgi:hypothetical protein